MYARGKDTQTLQLNEKRSKERKLFQRVLAQVGADVGNQNGGSVLTSTTIINKKLQQLAS